ncbi:MAG: hypothetical protein GY787_26530 [Alteromonadales bacterium]|nr:hypothetical protein [Alteromonadales bacterium]
MSYITVNGYQVPEQGTQDSEVPNYADAIKTALESLLQNKSTSTANLDVFIPGTGTLYYTASGVTIADGDFKYEIESGTKDLVTYVRRSGVWEEFQRSHESLGYISNTFTGKSTQSHESIAESDDSYALISNTNGYNRVGADVVIQNVNGLGAGDSSAGNPVIINTQGSVGTSDLTSLIQGIALVVSGDAVAEKIALNVRPNWTHALKVNGETGQAPLAGYTYDGVNVVDRSTEFSTPGNDVSIFMSDNDTIILGFTSPFSILEPSLILGASQDILATYQYSTGNDTFAPLTINSDTTNGFTSLSGQISFNPPVGWTTSNLYQGDSVLDLYYIKIRRTRNGLSTKPIASQFKLFQSGGSDMYIHGNGCIEPVTVSNSAASNNTIYFSVEENTLCWKDKTGVVNTIDITVA